MLYERVDKFGPWPMLVRITYFLFAYALTLAVQGQGLEPRLHASWGTNMLTSPGEDIRSSPGRTGAIAGSITIGTGWNAKVRIQPAIAYTGSAYRTRMAYRVFFVTVRNSLQADLLVAFPQMNGATLVVGPFVGRVQRARALFEQGEQSSAFQGFATGRLMAEHFPLQNEAGFVLGYSFPFSESGRFGIDLRFRQHLMPLVEQDQFFALQFSPDQQVLATNTRPSILSIGAYFRIK